MLEVIRSHNMKIDGEISMLLTNMLILESIAKDLDPSINILRCAVPYLQYRWFVTYFSFKSINMKLKIMADLLELLGGIRNQWSLLTHLKLPAILLPQFGFGYPNFYNVERDLFCLIIHRERLCYQGDEVFSSPLSLSLLFYVKR